MISHLIDKLQAGFEQACNDWILENFDADYSTPEYGEDSYWDGQAEEAVVEKIVERIFGG